MIITILIYLIIFSHKIFNRHSKFLTQKSNSPLSDSFNQLSQLIFISYKIILEWPKIQKKQGRETMLTMGECSIFGWNEFEFEKFK